MRWKVGGKEEDTRTLGRKMYRGRRKWRILQKYTKENKTDRKK